MSMTKKQAIAIFGGSGADLGRAVGLSRGRISQWPEELEQRETDLVVGAAIRLGKQLPPGLVAEPSEHAADTAAAA
jgi:transcriptional repressor of cell division inhibition gene dicB